MSFGIPVRNGLALGLTPSTTLASGRIGGRPALLLNFISTTALPSTITFSRGSNATLTDSTGKITYAPNNLLTNSESFEASVWNKFGCTVTANSTAAPDGTTTADALVEDGTTGLHYIQQFFSTFTAGVTYTISAYVKPGIRSWMQLFLPSAAFSGSPGSYFDLSGAGALGSVVGSPVARGITAVGNGWYRVFVTATATATAGGNVPIVPASANGTTSYAGTNGATAVSLWGAQLEQVTYQTTPGTYNSTTPKNLLGYTQEFDNAAWTKSNSFVQTNFLLRSQELSNAAWGLTGATVSADVTAAPDGTTTADRLVETTATSAHFVSQASITSVAGAPVTLSFYLKKGSLSTAPDFVQLYLAQAQFSATAYANYNIATGALGTVGAGSTATITPVGNGWYRCTLTATASASSSTATGYLLFCNNSGTAALAPSYTGATTSDVFVWGAQAVRGATAGDYQPTYAAAAAVQYAAPDGTLSADKLVATTAAGGHAAQQSVTTSAPVTVSFYAKAAEYSNVVVSSNSNNYVYFNLASGVVSSSLGTGWSSATITDVGNGWYRCAASTSVANTRYDILIANGVGTNGNTAPSYTGDGTSGIYVWGAQLSNSASLDTYVYNPGAAPTSAAYYGPRFDYDPVTLAPKGLLIEEQRSNLALNSQTFTTGWSSDNVANFVPNLITSPDGTVNAGQLQYVTGVYRYTNIATTVSTVYAFSIFAKLGTGGNNTIRLTAGAIGATFNLTTQAITNNTVTSATISDAGNGWYRCAITFTASVTTTTCGFNMGGTFTAGQGHYFWGAQLEAGAFATSYIPTVASTVTRSADAAAMLGTNFSSWYNQTQGAFVVSGDSAGGAVSGLYEASTSGTSAQSISVRLGQKFSYAQGLNRFDFSYTAGNVIRHGFAYLAGNYGAAVGGTALAVNANGQPADVPAGANQLALGCLGSGTFLLNGHIRTLSYYNTRLTNTQLQALTA